MAAQKQVSEAITGEDTHSLHSPRQVVRQYAEKAASTVAVAAHSKHRQINRIDPTDLQDFLSAPLIRSLSADETRKRESMTVPVAGKAYFGYGSNLWREQMALRCPASPFVGVGRLRGYRWFINRRGYANIKETGVETDEVWGLVYQLVPADEARLDKNEGVPHAYRKRMIPVEFSAANQTTAETLTTSRDMLVYIDSKRTSENHRPKDEYVHRLNSGIDDALYEGVPPSYVDHVLRKYIPTEEDAEAGLMGFMEGLSD